MKAVCRYRIFGNAQRFGYLLGRFSFPDQTGGLDLQRGEAEILLRKRLGKRRDNLPYVRLKYGEMGYLVAIQPAPLEFVDVWNNQALHIR